MKMIIFKCFVISTLMLLPITVLAQEAPPTTLLPQEGAVNSEDGKDLGGMIKDGSMRLKDLPLYVKYATEWLLYAIGTVAVVHIIIGGYQYIIGGLSENKEGGKKRIMYALVGLIVAALAWVVVEKVVIVATQ